MKKIYFLIITSLTFYISPAQVHQLWGTASSGGGPDTAGVIFKINDDGSSFRVAHSCDTASGYGPFGSLVQAPNGSFYGMMEDGGANTNSAGVIFQYDPATGIYTDVYDFDYYINGGFPDGSLIAATNGKLYGMTTTGGVNEYGTLFSFDPNTNTFTHLYDLSTSNANFPYGNLLQAADSNLYGLTSETSTDSTGSLFRYNITSNTFTVLHKFTPATGVDPEGTLIQATDGNLYGLTGEGGLYNDGVIFKYDLTGNVYTDVYDFNDTLGANPYGSLMQFIDVSLYGMTSFGGVNYLYGNIFNFNPATNAYSDVFDFSGSNGASPIGDLLQGTNNKIYGMTPLGGQHDNGVVFSFDPASSIYVDLVDFNLANGNYPSGGLIEINSTGISEKNYASIQIYPNPVAKELVVKNAGSGIQGIDIFDLLGEKVYTASEGIANETHIDVSAFSSGVYFVRLNNGQNQWSGKFIKE